MEYVFRMSGIYPVEKDKNRMILWTVYSSFLGVGFVLISLRSFEEERRKIVPGDVTSFVGTSQDLLIVISECFWIFGAIFHRKILSNVMEKVWELQLDQNQNGPKIDWIETSIIGILIILRSFLYVDISPYSGTWLSVSTLLADILISIGTIQFCNYMILIHKRFKMINIEITKLFSGNEEEEVVLHKIVHLSKAHSILSDLFSDLSKAFGLQILPFITNAFVRGLLTLFLDVKLLLGLQLYPIETLIVLTIWTSVILFDLMAVLFFCTSTRNEGIHSGHLIHKLICRRKLENNEKIFMFSLQIMHRVLDFSVCGMFNLDFSVLYNVSNNKSNFNLSKNHPPLPYIVQNFIKTLTCFRGTWKQL